MKKIGLFLGAVFYASAISVHSYIPVQLTRHFAHACKQAVVVIGTQYDDKAYTGAGVIFRTDGTVLTAAHLFNHAGKRPGLIEIVTYTGQVYEGNLLAIDVRKDLAIIQPIRAAGGFPFLKIRTGNYPYVGEDVIVIGHPGGNYWTVTHGIITKIYTPIRLGGMTKVEETDATINPGNSGGPMLDLDGRIIGIVSATWVNMFGIPTGIGIGISLWEIEEFVAEFKASEAGEQMPIRRYKILEVK